MKLYVTLTSPYARLGRILVLEKALEDRVDVIEAKTRVANSPYYQINPSGRVPYLIDDSGVGMEDSQIICAYLDSLDGKPRFHNPQRQTDWTYQRLEFAARNMCEGICVWLREMYRPKNERSPTVLAQHGTLDPRCCSRCRSKARLRRSHDRPTAACSLDARHVGAPFNAVDGPAVMFPNTPVKSAFVASR